MSDYKACRLCIHACKGDNDIFCYEHGKVITPDDDRAYACDDYDYVGYDDEER